MTTFIFTPKIFKKLNQMIMILSASELIMRAIMENMNSPDHISCFRPQIMEDNGFSFLKIEQF